MASIIQVGGKWRVQVRRKGFKPYTETFQTFKEAAAAGARVEAAMAEKKAEVLGDGMTVEALIGHYRRMRDQLGRPIAEDSNTEYMLRHLVEDLGGERVRDLTPQRLAKWAKMRKGQGAGGYTVNMELSALGTAIRHTASFLNCMLPDVVGAARPLLHYGQLIGGGGRRKRRPTEDELARLLAWLEARNPVTADAVRVAAITGLRRGEIARILWADVDELHRAVLVRKRKHPRQIEARDEWVPLLGDAWAIVQRQPRTDARIFPVSRETLTDSVTAATRELGIPDLRLHDMRREATSRLREMGFDDAARKAVTGHRSDRAHEVYLAVTLQELHERYETATQGKPQRPRRRRSTRDRKT